VLIGVFTLFAVFAPWIAPRDPAWIDLPARLAGPSHAHWFGTDELGRDMLSRIIYGSRISMLVGSSVVAGSLAIGTIIGSLAGYYGGRFDRFVNVVVMNAFMSFPGNFINRKTVNYKSILFSVKLISSAYHFFNSYG